MVVLQCSDVHSFNLSDQCAFINATDDCHISEGLINYNYFIYCSFGPGLVPLPVTLLVSVTS